MSSLTEQIDAHITSFFASWDIYTTVLAVLLAGLVLYPLLIWDEPDTHPLLLARQSRPAAVRQPKESAVYRSLDNPHGYPLRSGLNVKDKDSPRWAAGRDGDLRDIWRSAVAGGEDGAKGVIMTAHGKEATKDHDFGAISKEINAIGQSLQGKGEKVAIYLPNCLEYLSAVFACAFYQLSPVLLPYNQPHHVIVDLIKRTGCGQLVASAGSIPTELLHGSKINHITWIVEESSRQMDWTSDGNAVSVTAWHEIVANSSATSDLPENDGKPGNVTHVWLTKQGVPGQITEFTQANLVAAVAGLGIAIPQRQRLGPSDLVLPADSFAHNYVLCQTFAALYSHSSLVINSVAGPGVDLALATRTVSPTVIIASAETLAAIHQRETGAITNSLQKYAHISQAQAMTAGRMPTDTWLFKFLGPSASSTKPGQLRLIFASERLGSDSPALSSHMLSDIRIFTRARVCYALSAPEVAGAVAQTNMFDYRMDQTPGHSHFGVPLACCEVKLVSERDSDVEGTTPTGKIVVMGPSVVNGETTLDARGRFRDDATLAYA